VAEAVRKRRDTHRAGEELRELLTRYLYPGNPGSDLKIRVPLVPAMKDPWGPPTRTFSGSGNAVAASYFSAFAPWNAERIVQPIVDVHADDAPVLIASHLVSEPASRYFGNPKSLNPIHEPHYQDSHGGFKAKLRWAIYTPERAARVLKAEPFEGRTTIRKEPIHALSDLNDPKVDQPKFVRQGDIDVQKDDYLLVTVLPRDARFDRRIVSLAGVHKPGTLAAEKLLSDPDLALDILKKIDREVQGAFYYQALISLKVNHSEYGSPRPVELHFRGAETITVARL
jgi:hypothetical protein